jgi:hypothetical protein
MHSTMKAPPVLFVFLCACLIPVHALSKDLGPTFFNATDEVISIEIAYSQGSGFRGDLAPGQLERWPFAWQVQTVKVQLKDGRSFGVSEAEAVHLRGKLTKPRAQVWVIDGSHICVVASRRFKATKGLRCPVSG